MAVNIAFGITTGSFQTGLDKLSGSVTQFTSLTRSQFAGLQTSISAPITSLSKLSAQFGAASQSASPLLGTFSKLQGLAPGLSPLTGALGGLFAVDKIRGFAGEITATSGKFEKFGSILTNALQSGSGSKDSLRALSDFAATTPNQLEELTGSFIKFVNRGLIPSKQQLTNFGDLAASQGKGFDQLTEAILDAQSGEFERLKEFGVRASKSGDSVTLSFKGVTQTVKGTSEEITTAIQKFGQLTGVAGSMNAVAQTQEGLVSNLGDTYDRLLVALGEKGIAGGYKAAISAASSFLTTITDLIATSPADSLREQKTEINALVGAIALANDNEQVRLSLVQKLNQSYPEFLGKLNAESATTDLLAKRLADVNAQYDKKIRIALGEEKIKKKTEEYTLALNAQQEALELLAKASGKSLVELEKLDSKGRIALAKQVAQSQQLTQFRPSYFGQSLGTPVDNLAAVLEGSANQQKKIFGELNQLMGENTTRQTDLTKTTVDGYQAQIAQIQQKINLHKIDAKLGAEEIKRLNEQIRIAQGKPAPVTATTTKKATTSTGRVATPQQTGDVAILNRYISELETKIQNLGGKAPLALVGHLNDARSALESLLALTDKSQKVSIVGAKEIIDPESNKKVQQIVGYFTDIARITPGMFDKTAAKDFFNEFTLARPTLEFFQNKAEELKRTIGTMGLNKLGVPKEAIESLKNYTAGILSAQRAIKDASDKATGGAQLSLAMGDIAVGNTWSNLPKVISGFTDAAIASFGENRDRLVLTAQDMVGSMVSVLQQGVSAGAEAMGGFIGGLISGTSRIADLPKIILGTIGDMFKKLGTTLISSAAFLLFVPGLQGQAIAQLAAGTGLVGLGTALSSIKGYAKGGLFKGESLIRVGESSRALAGGGEFVAPVALGAKLIATNIMQTLKVGEPKIFTPSYRDLKPDRSPQYIEIGGEFRMNGYELLAMVERSREAREYFT